MLLTNFLGTGPSRDTIVKLVFDSSSFPMEPRKNKRKKKKKDNFNIQSKREKGNTRNKKVVYHKG